MGRWVDGWVGRWVGQYACEEKCEWLIIQLCGWVHIFEREEIGVKVKKI